jgi:hypothetical protein
VPLKDLGKRFNLTGKYQRLLKLLVEVVDDEYRETKKVVAVQFSALNGFRSKAIAFVSKLSIQKEFFEKSLSISKAQI